MHALAIHGGAGALPRSAMTPEVEARYCGGLEAALDAGAQVLARGGTALDAVTSAVKALEDDPIFNAGRGAVLTRRGRAELDASIMSGRDLAAGAVAGIEHVRNPIELARRVMEKSRHVLLVGEGAEEFALEEGLVLVPNEYFRTPERERALQRAQDGERTWELVAPPHGTVGAVALDEAGNLAAATSTGGTTRKRPGRVGDSPIIGAGTYAKNGVCAVSATGYGEFFIRTVAAYDVCAQMEYSRRSLADAVSTVLREKIGRMGGDGGIIAIAADGAIVMDFNTEGMFRGVRDSRGRREVALFR
ncbi:MAG: isoaspartyl peptidase/L-asparaginase family protein [Steroidobacteraceae bacterium]